MQEPISLTEKLQASLDLVHARKAKGLWDVGHAAALLVAQEARPDTGEVLLGCGWPVEVVRAFAKLSDARLSTQISRRTGMDAPTVIECATALVGGVRVVVQGSRSAGPEDLRPGPRAA